MTDRKQRVYTIRGVPDDVHEELEAWANEEMRSVNTLVVRLLRDAVLRRRALRDTPDGGDPLLGGESQNKETDEHVEALAR